VETADKEDPVRPDVYEIAVVPGDGIGPEVSNATVSVLSSALDDSVGVKFTDHEAGAECYLKTGTAFPEATLQACKAADAILRGDTATDTLVLTRYGIERIVRMAARIALKGDGAPEDGVKRVSIVDKANVLRSYAFFRTVADEVLAGYTDGVDGSRSRHRNVPKCGFHQGPRARGAIRHASYHRRPRSGDERFSGSRY